MKDKMTPKAKQLFKEFCAEQGMDKEDIDACRWYAAGLIEFAEWILQKQEWVSVKERMPDKKGYYLVVVEESVASRLRGTVEISDCFEGIDMETMKPTLRFQDYVTHWQPRPEPPKQL